MVLLNTVEYIYIYKHGYRSYNEKLCMSVSIIYTCNIFFTERDNKTVCLQIIIYCE